MAQMHVFVSHSHQDMTFCQAIITALASQWVMDECDWAYDLQKDEPSRSQLRRTAITERRAKRRPASACEYDSAQ